MVSSEGLGYNIAKIIAIAFVVAQFRTAPGARQTSLIAKIAALCGLLCVFVLLRTWLGLVVRLVPSPYLDEVFHIPQAQKYCQGKWTEWDDKITTPPGLYAIAAMFFKLFSNIACSTAGLRGLNNLGICHVGLAVCICRHVLERRASNGRRKDIGLPYSFYACHTSFNITLFPVLFFFSALFYTDVYSTLLVVVCYQNHLRRISYDRPPFWNDLIVIVLGVAALTMRQTNIFWVAIYMGGLEVVHAVKQLKPPPVETPRFITVPEMIRFYAWRYSLGDVHDPPITLSWPDDWAISLLSIAVAAVWNPVRVLRQIWPHIMVLDLFGAFVYWNGGVVLGDKSNHVATLHLAQLLYIWPLFVFFSTPLFLPYIVRTIGMAKTFVAKRQRHNPLATSTLPTKPKPSQGAPGKGDKAPTGNAAQPAANGPPQSIAVRLLNDLIGNKTYYPLYALTYLTAMFLVVRHNTIIHPFTLADNRHYMFYVFRYTILRPGAARYLLVPVYALCSRLCWQVLFGCIPGTTDECNEAASVADQGGYIKSPFASQQMALLRKKKNNKTEADKETVSREVSAAKVDILGTLDEPESTSTICPPTSTALLWLLATVLSLVTAPLVEPRYFILPWVFWRLLVPAWPAHECVSSDEPGTRLDRLPVLGWIFKIGKRFDLRLILETAWLLAINLATMYIFLLRPYRWRAEDGSLMDGGRWQRFMW